jgi:hypothetical protein
VNRRTLLPILWPLLLLLFGQFDGGLLVQIEEQRLIRVRLEESRGRLDSVRAQAVAGRLESLEYQALLKEFGALTSLQVSDPFRDPQSVTLGSVHVASLIRGLQNALAQPPEEGAPEHLEFLSVSPGGQQRIGPFVMMEFVLNLRGRFGSIPSFFRLMARLGHHRRLAISIGELRIDSTQIDPVTGEGLAITLPVRAYFRE